IILPSGVVRTVQEDGEIICDQSGQAVKILGTVQDISRFKAIERALQDSEVKFRNLVEQFPGVIYIAAIDESNTLIYVSPQIKTMLGFSPKIWKKNKKIWSSRLHPDDRERVLAEIRESRQNVTPFFSEYRIFSRNKRMVWLRHEAVIVREPDGVPIFMQGMMTDITALKEVAQEQETMQAVMRQQEKMASIGQLAAGVAHEINNPMGFIGSNLGTMGKYVRKLTDFLRLQDQIIREKRYDEMIDSLEGQRKKDKIDYIMDDVVDLVAESQDGVERVKKIVQGLKSFSRVDEAQFNEVDVKECLESTINIIWNELKYKAEVVKDFGSLPLFKGYPQQLNQVFMNLLVNAAQAIEENGKIFISARSDGDDIIIAIRDTGQGIPADILPRIFDPFFTTKEVGKGTGLGLSISYEIIKKHGGIISVESEVGVGTTFTVNIPIKGQTQDAIALN
ncbi:MAG: ATP-binding protein, partial [Desulfobulbaceae bacterium]|nr:ATP-binding protein [Desulfobulbaceae bacterium]